MNPENLQSQLDANLKDYKERIAKLRSEFSESFSKMKITLQSGYEKTAVSLCLEKFVETNLLDYCKDVAVLPHDSMTSFLSTLGVRCLVQKKSTTSVTEFEKELQLLERANFIEFEVEDELDEFYATLTLKKMARVLKFTHLSHFHNKIVQLFDLHCLGSNVSKSDSYTVCHGIFIEGKLHGTAKIMLSYYSDMQFFLVGNFKAGELHGNCAFITTK